MSTTSIEWTDVTWNPVRGCTKVSPGCKHCYAETFAERWRGVPGHAYEQGFDPRLVPEKLGEPLTWRKPRRIFVNSMSDWLHEVVPNEYAAAMLGVAANCPRHTFQFLTKRAERLPQLFDWLLDRSHEGVPCSPEFYCQVQAWRHVGDRMLHPIKGTIRSWPWPLQNVWLGVSVEDRKYGLPRVEHLRATPAAVRFLSVEPLLEDLGELDLRGIHWVIVGAESGRAARDFNDAWVRSIRDQCAAAGVSFFFKQGPHPKRRGRVISLPLLDGQQHAAFPGAA